jgi:hypothetical protein
MSEAKDIFFVKYLFVEDDGSGREIFLRLQNIKSNEKEDRLRKRFNNSNWSQLIELIEKHAPEKLI